MEAKHKLLESMDAHFQTYQRTRSLTLSVDQAIFIAFHPAR